MLPLEVREPGFDRCEPRVLFLQMLGFFLQLLGLFPQQTRSLLDVVDGSPVEHRQQAPPRRQRGDIVRPAHGWGPAIRVDQPVDPEDGEVKQKRARCLSDRGSSGVEAGPRCPPSLAQIRERDWLREGNRPAPRPGGIKQTAVEARGLEPHNCSRSKREPELAQKGNNRLR